MTGSLRAFSRGTPRTIAGKEEAWYRALTLQTFLAFEGVVPIVRDRVKNSTGPVAPVSRWETAPFCWVDAGLLAMTP